jgi:hypothetical protein
MNRRKMRKLRNSRNNLFRSTKAYKDIIDSLGKLWLDVIKLNKKSLKEKINQELLRSEIPTIELMKIVNEFKNTSWQHCLENGWEIKFLFMEENLIDNEIVFRIEGDMATSRRNTFNEKWA